MKHRNTSNIRQNYSLLKNNPFNVKKVAFAPKAFKQIRETIGSRPAESGGALFIKHEDLVSGIPYIREFVFDKGSDASRVTYTIDDKFVNQQIHNMSDKYNLIYAGQAHSHPYGCRNLSSYDVEYFHTMHTYMERPFIIAPVIFTECDGGKFQIFCYLVGDKMQPVEVETCVLDEAEYEKAIAELHAVDAVVSEVVEVTEKVAVPEDTVILEEYNKHEDETNQEIKSEENAETSGPKHIDYSRIVGAEDLNLLAKSKIVKVGAGGTFCLSGMYARNGVGEEVDIDPDTVDATNICRQGYYLRQVGMTKVDALGEYIHEINPDMKYTGYAKKVQDLTFEEIMTIMDGASIIIAATDSFEAQAFCNKLAILFNVPIIFAGFYERSLASEIIFWIPGVTEACFRCITSSRYKFQEEYKAKNEGHGFSVSSNCNTIFHSELLDAQIGMLTMAILHNDTQGLTFSGWFGDHFDQNIIQMKVNPGYESKLFDNALPDDRAFLFNSVWQHVKAEVPPEYELCPDCHGKYARQINQAHKDNQ